MNIKRRILALATALIMSLGFGVTCFAAASTAVTKTVSTPKASEKPGVYAENLYVELSCPTRDARIFYTTDGREPTINSTEYTGKPIRIKADAGERVHVTICAIAVKTGYENSEVAEFRYTVDIPSDLDVKYMEIDTEPRKTRYDKGEELNLEGGYIVVTYEDGTYEELPMTEKMISGFNTNTAGEKLITVTYKDFKDTFTITVKGAFDGSQGGGTTDEEEESNDNAEISGTKTVGWEAITKAVAGKTYGATVKIETNGSVAVPADLIRAAISRGVTLIFVIDESTRWTLRTKGMSDETVPAIGVGLRTDAVYIPDVAVNMAGGKAAYYLHINSDNRLSAKLTLSLDEKYASSYASLFRYDAEENRLILADTAKIDKSGNVSLVPDLRGDYVIISDSVTKIAGDVNNSMTLTAADASEILKMLVSDEPCDPRADFNGDGLYTAGDAAALLMSLVL